LALTLGEGRDRAQALTRHRTDTRIDSDDWDTHLNEAAREIRLWLEEKVPSLYLVTTDAIELDDDDPEISLDTIEVRGTAYNFSNLYRVERLYNETEWRPVRRADAFSPNTPSHGDYVFRVEHLCLIFGPDYVDVSGSYRFTFHPRPSLVTDENAYFQIPAGLDQTLIYLACSLSVIQDHGPTHEHVAAFRKLAQEDFDKALPSLKKRHGIHTRDHGARKVYRRGWR
jgi:hypothetical protein